MKPGFEITQQTSQGQWLASISGEWRLGQPTPVAENMLNNTLGPLTQPLAHPLIISFDASKLEGWDGTLLAFLREFVEGTRMRSIELDRTGLPEGIRRLIALSEAVAEREGAAARPELPLGFFWRLAQPITQIGNAIIGLYGASIRAINFVGELTQAFLSFLLTRAGYRKRDFWITVTTSGPYALPIVSLISFLVGLILAFVGALQLKMFGAQIYIADLVAIGMTREMGAMMTGIIMAGRTGAAFAAQLGSMQANDEIDALRTFGFSPMKFLILPRVLGLMLMMPFLCLYADLVGIFGGFMVGLGVFDITFMEYVNQTREAFYLTDFWIGLFKSAIFGILTACVGCYAGLTCKRNASAVGAAVTFAVVCSIVLIVVADATITLICTALGI